MYLIDTNFLELFLDRERGEECENFLSKVENGEVTLNFEDLTILQHLKIKIEICEIARKSHYIGKLR